MAIYMMASNTFSVSNGLQYSTFLDRFKQQNTRADLFGALIARTFSSEATSYALAEFSLSLPPIDVNQKYGITIERPEIFSLQNGASTTSKQKEVVFAAEVDYNSKELMTERGIQQSLLLGLLGVETKILYLSSLPQHEILGNSYFGAAKTVVLGVIMKFREIFVYRLLLNIFCTSFDSSTDSIVSPAGEAFIAAIKILLHIMDTSILQIMHKYEVHEHEDNLNEDIIQFWEFTSYHRIIIFQLVRMVSPPELFYLLNKSQTKQKSYFDAYYGKDGSLCNGWGILERLLISYARHRAIPWMDVPLELKHELYGNRMTMASAQTRSDSVLMDIDMCLVAMTCQLIKSVSEPLLGDVCSKLYNIQFKQILSAGFLRHRSENLLSMSIDTIWEAVQKPSHSLTIKNRESNMLIEQLLAACAWADGRIAILHSDEGTVDEEQRSRKVPISIDAQRRSIRDQLTRPFQEIVATLTIPVTADDEIAWTKVKVKSAAIIHVFRKDLSALMKEWASPSSAVRRPVKDSNILDDDSIESLHISSISEDDGSLQIAPLGDAEKNEAVEKLDPTTLTVEREDLDVQELKSEDPNRRLLTLFYTSPLNIERTVETSLVLAAKDRLTLKYDALMNDLEKRSAKAVWQVKRLKGVQQARKELRQRRENEIAQLSAERVNRRHYSVPDERKQELETLTEQDEEEEELELSNESQFIIAKDPIPIENEIMEESESLHVVDLPLLLERTEPHVESAKSLIYGVANNAVVNSLVPSVKVAQDPGGNSSICLSHDVVEETVAAPKISVHEESFPVAPMSDSQSYFSADSEGSEMPESLGEKITDSADVASTSTSSDLDETDGDKGSHSPLVDDGAAEEPTIIMEVEPLPETPLDIDAHFSKSLQHRRDSFKQHSFDMEYSSVVDNLLKPDMVYLEQEEAAREALASLPRAFSLMALSLGIVEYSSEDDAPLVESSLSLKPFSAVMHESVGAAVKVQCAALNLAALYSVVAASDLLGHLDSVERLFLVSPKSDFLTAISTALVDRFVEQNKLFLTDHIDVENPRRRAQNKAIPCLWQNEILSTIDATDGLHGSYQRLWSPWRIQEAVGIASTRSYVNSVRAKYIHMARYHIYAPNTDTSSSAVAAYDPIYELCSMHGLQFLKLEYLTDWPIPAIITQATLDRIGSMTRRLLELSQLNELLRITWAQLRVRQQFSQRLMARNGQRGKSFRLLDREINSCFRILQSTVQALLNFMSDRVHSSSQRLRDRMVRSAHCGLDEAVSAIEEYAHCLQIASFVPVSEIEEELIQKYIAYEEDEESDVQHGLIDTVVVFKVRLTRLLDICRGLLKSFLDFCNRYSSADVGEEKVVHFLAAIVESSNHLQYMKRQLSDENHTKFLPAEERMNGDIMAMYLLS